MKGLVQTCIARPPRPGHTIDEAGCNVTGCDEKAHTIIEVGGGWHGSTSVQMIRLCIAHADHLRAQLGR